MHIETGNLGHLGQEDLNGRSIEERNDVEGKEDSSRLMWKQWLDRVNGRIVS